MAPYRTARQQREDIMDELRRIKKAVRQQGALLEHLHTQQQSGAVALDDIKKELRKMSTASEAALARLTASVAANTTVDQSILDLVTRLAQEVRDNANDPAALNALADQIDADAQRITEAVNANTPAPPAG